MVELYEFKTIISPYFEAFCSLCFRIFMGYTCHYFKLITNMIQFSFCNYSVYFRLSYFGLLVGLMGEGTHIF